MKRGAAGVTLKQLVRVAHVSKPAHIVMAILGRKYPRTAAEFEACGLAGKFDEHRAGTRMKVGRGWEPSPPRLAFTNCSPKRSIRSWKRQ